MQKISIIKERCAFCHTNHTNQHCTICNKPVCRKCAEYPDKLEDTRIYCPDHNSSSPGPKLIPKKHYETREMYPEEHILDLIRHYWHQRKIIDDDDLFDYIDLVIKGINPFLIPKLVNMLKIISANKDPNYDVTASPAFHITHEQLTKSLIQHLQEKEK
ncbi:MAG: hypothetical protein ACFFCI_00575 [Promethearchaeota archaeon]